MKEPIPKRRPLIGVTGPCKGAWPSWFCTRLMIFMGGGRAYHITPNDPLPPAPLDGLVLGGGADVSPTRYKEKLLASIKVEARTRRKLGFEFFFSVALWLLRKLLGIGNALEGVDERRDELEFRLLEEALSRNVPVLGICRGSQLINVHLGGSLYQDLANFYVERPQLRTVLPKKWIQIVPGTHLAHLLGTPKARVNSLHRQAVNRLGEGMAVAARETNGVVQAIEHANRPYLIGVQWHPEFLFTHSDQRRLFRALVKCAMGTECYKTFPAH